MVYISIAKNKKDYLEFCLLSSLIKCQRWPDIHGRQSSRNSRVSTIVAIPLKGLLNITINNPTRVKPVLKYIMYVGLINPVSVGTCGEYDGVTSPIAYVANT